MHVFYGSYVAGGFLATEPKEKALPRGHLHSNSQEGWGSKAIGPGKASWPLIVEPPQAVWDPPLIGQWPIGR